MNIRNIILAVCFCIVCCAIVGLVFMVSKDHGSNEAEATPIRLPSRAGGIWAEQSINIGGGRLYRVFDDKTKTYCYVHDFGARGTSISCVK